MSHDDRPLTDADILAFMRRLAIQVAREEYEAEKARLRPARPDVPGPMLLPKDIAKRWGCSDRTVRNMIMDGQLPGYRIGTKLLRVRLEDVKRYEQDADGRRSIRTEEVNPPEPSAKADPLSRLRLAALRARAHDG